MKKTARFALLAASLAAASSLLAQAPDPHAEHAKEAAAKPSPAAAPAPRNEAIPPDADQVKDALAKSPRHGEWVDVALPGGGKLLTWVVYPEKKEKAGIVIVIHEIFGLTDWVRGVADQLAKEGPSPSRPTSSREWGRTAEARTRSAPTRRRSSATSRPPTRPRGSTPSAPTR